MESLGEPDSAECMILKGWTAGKEMKCDGQFSLSLEDSDVILADVIWKFDRNAVADYRTFIKRSNLYFNQHETISGIRMLSWLNNHPSPFSATTRKQGTWRYMMEMR